MSYSQFAEIRADPIEQTEIVDELEDLSIPCIDCGQEFVWTVGEQIFFRNKQLDNPPKRCKECKRAKNRRLEAIEIARVTGKRHRIEVKASCANCSAATTVPFYPCQGRPVYCRGCYVKMNNGIANGAGGAA